MTVDNNLKHNLQFMILTHLWPWKQGPRSLNCYNKAKFEQPRLNSVHERANSKVLSNQETCPLSPFNVYDSKKYQYIHDAFNI